MRYLRCAAAAAAAAYRQRCLLQLDFLPARLRCAPTLYDGLERAPQELLLAQQPRQLLLALQHLDADRGPRPRRRLLVLLRSSSLRHRRR